jgi:hypothetical protein
VKKVRVVYERRLLVITVASKTSQRALVALWPGFVTFLVPHAASPASAARQDLRGHAEAPMLCFGKLLVFYDLSYK